MQSNLSRQRGRGYVLLLWLFLIFATGMFFYYFRLVSPGIELDTGQKDKNPPWQQWAKIEKRLARGGLGQLDSKQLQFKEPLMLTADLFEGQNNRGTIAMLIDPNGIVKGQWSGTFRPSSTLEHEVIVCRFKGYLDPKEIPADSQQAEPAKIYFLTKGTFLIVEYNYDNNRVRNVVGRIYVSGWLGSDHNVKGKATITSDDKHFKSFEFSSQARLLGFRPLEW